jgi:hypothetical protein
MDAHTMSRLPSISVSIRPSLLTRGYDLVGFAGAAGVQTVTLDLSAGLSKQLAFRQAIPLVPTSAIWLGNPWLGLWNATHHRERLGDLVRLIDPPAVAVDLDPSSGGLIRPATLIERVEQTRRLVGRDRSVLVTIRAEQLLGGRRHLSDLTAFRHLAEEWELGVALDLTGSLDATWEAEAAVFRLGNHLRLMRIPTTATDRLAVGQSRVIARALGAAMDQSYPPEVTLAPSVPLLWAMSDRARAEATAKSVLAIHSRVENVSSQRAHFLRHNLWPNLRG